MFKILELKGNSTQAAEVGRRHSRREEALGASGYGQRRIGAGLRVGLRDGERSFGETS